MERSTLGKKTGLSLSEVKSTPPHAYPHCHELMTPSQYKGGDTVDFEYNDAIDNTFFLRALYGTCPHCQERFSSLLISHISHAPDGYSYMNLHDHDSESRKSYEVTGSGLEWTIDLHINVTGPFFVACERETRPRDFTSTDVFPWLNIHWIGPAAFADYENTMERARTLFYDLKPKILSLDWSNQE